MALSKPNKHLYLDEAHFEGYWVRLQALLRHNEDADEILDGIQEFPLKQIFKPTNGELKADLQADYEALGLQMPTAEDLTLDPIGAIRDFIKCSQNSEKERVTTFYGEVREDLLKYRKGIKFIYETVVATLSTSQATEFVGSLPYGSGRKLLEKVRLKQHRQTSMSLYTLFENIISLKLKPTEKLSSLFSRLTAMRRRLANWTPPIRLPDQLILVCILRSLPTKYKATRTIIMSSRNVDLTTAKTMLLDAENADAQLIHDTLGSTDVEAGNKALITKPERKKTKKSKNFTEAYKREGPCPVHPWASHGPSECYTLHPKLRPKNWRRKGSDTGGLSAVASSDSKRQSVDSSKDSAFNSKVSEETDSGLYGFLTGECLSVFPFHPDPLPLFTDIYQFLEPTENGESVSGTCRDFSKSKQPITIERSDPQPSNQRLSAETAAWSVGGPLAHKWDYYEDLQQLQGPRDDETDLTLDCDDGGIAYFSSSPKESSRKDLQTTCETEIFKPGDFKQDSNRYFSIPGKNDEECFSTLVLKDERCFLTPLKEEFQRAMQFKRPSEIEKKKFLCNACCD